ncbi:alanine racemase [Anaerobranca californiensis DSM 14826]|jgi:alanine racemase|uniref:Alanine racemase n=1 Tax=Anaerobranca californiensis DSM 14826 TaxID=1120989 RepID=A0A1M6RU39_9FIRM|nr:alanine racemase [Anaerobranca californiensis]SHK36031.1 alanine racemase [Anaerobranca californiensis DSM 14826]
MYRKTFAEIHLDNIVYNISLLTEDLPKGTKIMAVVKGDGYGHGSVEVSKAAIKGGADYLAVALVEEGIHLRKNGINDIPILVLGYTPPQSANDLIKYNITPTLYDLGLAKALNSRLTSKIKAHVKVDTGMGRLGVLPENIISFLLELRKLDNIEVEGIFTHYAAGEEKDNPHTVKQFLKFKEILANLPYPIPLKHIANSGGVMESLTDETFNMVRLGIAIYGLYPSPKQKEKWSLKPALELKSEIVYLKDVEKGTPISYSMTYKTPRPSTIATIPIGYADGYFRDFSNKGFVTINGKKAPVVGRVCMDYIMVDVTGLPVNIGDEVVLYALKGDNTVDNLAPLIDTINYELVCAISKRVPRIYRGLES